MPTGTKRPTNVSTKALAVSTVLIVLLALCAPASAGELDRATALKILRANGKPPDRTVTLGLLRTLHTKPSLSAVARDDDAGTIGLLDALVAGGILTKVGTSKIADYRGGQATQLQYALKDSATCPRPKFTGPGFESDDETTFVIAHRRFDSVTGITQNGPHAEAEVNVSFDPTPCHQRITEIINGATGISIDPLTQDGVIWPMTFKDQHETIKYRFIKYDDGWRLDNP